MSERQKTIIWRKKYHLMPSEREKECTEHQYIWTGNVRGVRGFSCMLCGKPREESADETA